MRNIPYIFNSIIRREFTSTTSTPIPQDIYILLSHPLHNQFDIQLSSRLDNQLQNYLNKSIIK